jgi:hypothetical protein
MLAALLAILLAAGGAVAGPPDPLDTALDALVRMLDSPRLMVLDQAVGRTERAVAAAEHASPPDPEAVRAARAEHERAVRARQESLRPVWRAVNEALGADADQESLRDRVVRDLQEVIGMLGELRDPDGLVDAKRRRELEDLIAQLKEADPHDPEMQQALGHFEQWAKGIREQVRQRQREEARREWEDLLSRVERAAVEGQKGTLEQQREANGLQGAANRYRNARRNRAKLIDDLREDAARADALLADLAEPAGTGQLSEQEWEAGLATVDRAVAAAAERGGDDERLLAAIIDAQRGADEGIGRDSVNAEPDGPARFREMVAEAAKLLGTLPEPVEAAPEPPALAAGTQDDAAVEAPVEAPSPAREPEPGPERRASGRHLRWIDALLDLVQPLLDEDLPDAGRAGELWADLDDLLVGGPTLSPDQLEEALEAIEAEARALAAGTPGQGPALASYEQARAAIDAAGPEEVDQEPATVSPGISDLELRMQPIFQAAWAAQDVQGDDERSAELRQRGGQLAGDAEELLLGKGLDPAGDEARLAELERRAEELARDTGGESDGEAGAAPAPTGGGEGGEGGGGEPVEPNAHLGARTDLEAGQAADGDDPAPDEHPDEHPGGLAAAVIGIAPDPAWRPGDQPEEEKQQPDERKDGDELAARSLDALGRGAGRASSALPPGGAFVQGDGGDVGIALCRDEPRLPGCPGALEPDAIPDWEPPPPAADLPELEPPEQAPDVIEPHIPGLELDDLPGLRLDDPPVEPDLKLPDPTQGIEFLSGTRWTVEGGLVGLSSPTRCGLAC